MYPSPSNPVRGSFVRDQVRALARLPGVAIELFHFAPGGASPYPRAARELRRRYRGADFDVIHSHFGLTAWPSLALRGAPHVVTLHGTDLVARRSRVVTLAALPFIDLAAPVSRELAALVPRALVRGRVTVLPCGADLQRFSPIARADARRALGLALDRRYVLFPADPGRTEKRYDRARAVVAGIGQYASAYGESAPGTSAPGTSGPRTSAPGASGPGTSGPGKSAHAVELLTLGRTPPDEVPLWVNAADAVLVPSERESFGLAVIEALSCDVPVLATDVGIAPEALAGVAGAYCGPFDLGVWCEALVSVLADPDPRVDGRAAAERYSADRMAVRVLEAWQALA
jgi:glycosyltransferase involved in cell wall biosynthesis